MEPKHSSTSNAAVRERLMAELDELDTTRVWIEGSWFKPSQCYRYETDPFHLLFNTNCPDDLKQKVEGILTKYLPANETNTP